MDTEGIMRLALQMAGMQKVPPDSGIWVPGKRVKTVLFSVDAGPSEISMAKQMGYDLLIAHHPSAAAKLGCGSFVTSAKTGENVESAFRSLSVGIVRKYIVR